MAESSGKDNATKSRPLRTRAQPGMAVPQEKENTRKKKERKKRRAAA
jgi:hypothetical protein